MSFTAKDVQALRERTGVGMMDCKKALVETNGDMDAAVDILRKKGLAAAEKKAGRIAAEGVVISMVDDEKQLGVVLEVNSETDFVAKNEQFQAFVGSIARTIIDTRPADVEDLKTKTIAGGTETVAAALQEKVLTIGENIQIRRFVLLEGRLVAYIHGGGRLGVLVRFETEAPVAEFLEAAKDVAMQIAALNPSFVDRDSVPAETLAHEKEILTEQVMAEGKPANIAEKIVMGKLSKYYKENCLVEQDFVKDGDLTVGKYIEKVAAEIGKPVKIAEFIRWEKGEGLQKREDNFADEVASMMK